MAKDGGTVYGSGTNPLVISGMRLLEAIDPFSLKTPRVRHTLRATQTATFTPTVTESTEVHPPVSIDKPAQPPPYFLKR